VLCEKPMALDPSDVDRVAEAAKTAGVVVSEAFMYRHHAQTHQILTLLDEGAVGELRLVRGCFSFLLTRDDDVRLKPEWGGGSLWDVGCYPVSYARLVMGAEPVAVCGLSERGPTGIDLAFCGALQFPGGRLATFDCGFRAAFRTFMEFVGTEASLEAPNPFKPGPHEHLRLVRDGMATTIDVQGAALYSGEVEDLEYAALDGRAPVVSLADTRGNVAVLAALYQSAARV
jgi:predicted dehydrogenase